MASGSATVISDAVGTTAMVRVEWLGHACFLVTGKSVTVLVDPFAVEAGLDYPAISVRADVLLVTHEHLDHNNMRAAKGNPVLIRGPGEWEAPIDVKGIVANHDASGGSQRGKTTVYRFEVDSVAFCHMGDIGEIPDEKTLRWLMPLDVLMVPVGGVYTIDSKGADQLIGILNPRIVLPMHYKNEFVRYPLATVEPFIRGKGNVTRESSNTVVLSKSSLPSETRIIVLSPPRARL